MKLKRDTLVRLRWQGLGPAFKRHGGRIVYRREDLEAWHKAHSRRRTAVTARLHAAPVLGLMAGVAFLAASCFPKRPLLVWNASTSVPVGLYRIAPSVPGLGDLALARLTGPIAELADHRGYLPRNAYLLKPVAAVGGDRVCRFGVHVFVRHRLAALALGRTTATHPMPNWQGCRTLRNGELLLLADDRASFDGRYFGPLGREHIVGHAVRLGD